MVWSEQRDVICLREVAAEGLLTKKEKSRERGAGLQTVANNLHSVFDTELTSRSVRDHYIATCQASARQGWQER